MSDPDIYEMLYDNYSSIHYYVYGMSMIRWSRAAWGFLHGITFLCPTLDLQNIVPHFSALLPCMICTYHLNTYISKYPYPEHSCSSYDWAKWVIGLHNDVNKRCSKSPIHASFEDVRIAFDKRSKDEVTKHVQNCFWEFVWIVYALKKDSIHIRQLVVNVSEYIDPKVEYGHIMEIFQNNDITPTNALFFQNLQNISLTTLQYTTRWWWTNQSHAQNIILVSQLIPAPLTHSTTLFLSMMFYERKEAWEYTTHMLHYCILENLVGANNAKYVLPTTHDDDILVNMLVQSIDNNRKSHTALLNKLVPEKPSPPKEEETNNPQNDLTKKTNNTQNDLTKKTNNPQNELTKTKNNPQNDLTPYIIYIIISTILIIVLMILIVICKHKLNNKTN